MSKIWTSQDFLNECKDKPFLLVVIYADWCGHCQRMKQTLGDKFQQYDKLIFIEESNVDPALRDYYPHIRLYQNGQTKDLTVQDLYQVLGVKAQ